ncbi:Cell number regulator 11 [Picochlorum sp. SENEW3]|nr:Cell number regulator 11 [Picochlorum sp. SENEW3]WPT18362.1 Cell number regulator 11 [Picochlorum sp. SENEW3]
MVFFLQILENILNSFRGGKKAKNGPDGNRFSSSSSLDARISEKKSIKVTMATRGPPQSWNHGLCSCFTDCGICCWGYWCPCWLYGDTAKKLDTARGIQDAGCCLDCCVFFLLSFFCLQGFVGCGRRRDLRTQFNLQGEDCPACCAYTCCGGCAVCQDANEYRYREREIIRSQQQQQVQMQPVVQQQMTSGDAAQKL